MIDLQTSSAVPLYLQLADQLEAEARTNPPAGRPTQQHLADRLGICRPTVRRALDVLAERGMTWHHTHPATAPRPS